MEVYSTNTTMQSLRMKKTKEQIVEYSSQMSDQINIIYSLVRNENKYESAKQNDISYSSFVKNFLVFLLNTLNKLEDFFEEHGIQDYVLNNTDSSNFKSGVPPAQNQKGKPGNYNSQDPAAESRNSTSQNFTQPNSNRTLLKISARMLPNGNSQKELFKTEKSAKPTEPKVTQTYKIKPTNNEIQDLSLLRDARGEFHKTKTTGFVEESLITGQNPFLKSRKNLSNQNVKEMEQLFDSIVVQDDPRSKQIVQKTQKLDKLDRNATSSSNLNPSIRINEFSDNKISLQLSRSLKWDKSDGWISSQSHTKHTNMGYEGSDVGKNDWSVLVVLRSIQNSIVSDTLYHYDSYGDTNFNYGSICIMKRLTLVIR